MNEKHREIAEGVFNNISMTMTELGKIVPVFLLILSDETIYPVIIKGEEYNIYEYATIVNDIAKQMDASAMIVVCEQMMVSKTSSDVEIQALLNGTLRPSDHPDSKPYLTLMYSDSQGNCESIIAEIHTDLTGTKFTREQSWISQAITNILVPWK